MKMKKIIFVDSCKECPYRFEGAIVSYCNGQYLPRGKVVRNKPLVDSLDEIPEWCPLEGADIC